MNPFCVDKVPVISGNRSTNLTKKAFCRTGIRSDLSIKPCAIHPLFKYIHVYTAHSKMSARSIQSSVTTSTFQTPLSQIVTCNNFETLLVTDSVSCDGRFVLYTIAAAALTKTSKAVQSVPTFTVSLTDSNHVKSRVLWISCTSVTDESIINALKKIGCDRDVLSSIAITTTHTKDFNGSERLCIHSITSSISEATSCDVDDDASFVKALYGHIKDFVSKHDKNALEIPTIIIVDDISALSVLVGERLAYSLIFSLNSLKSITTHPFGLVVRCSNDYDIDAAELAVTGRVVNSDQSTTTNIPWERSLVELADSIVDVTLLPSGYSREVHGRISLSNRSADASSTGTYNFCLTDNQVLVMRLAT